MTQVFSLLLINIHEIQALIDYKSLNLTQAEAKILLRGTLKNIEEEFDEYLCDKSMLQN
ncbi:MAG: hypothetical protein PHV37_03950 [Candidatus Gastranaerophilales bacterium]|nr:hypothetical protein [Candidatus Gastranaerophilales bacterium]